MNGEFLTGYHSRVLIFDDDFQLGELLREYLQTTNRCAVTYVTTEAEFWTALEGESFDVVFLDYKLGETTGLDILARMTKAGMSVPAVMMTGEGSEQVAAKAIRAGAIDYLVKGEYSFTALPALILKAVRQGQIQRELKQNRAAIDMLTLLVNLLPEAVAAWDERGLLTVWNRAAEALFGAPASERIGKDAGEAFLSGFTPALPAWTDGNTPWGGPDGLRQETVFSRSNGEQKRVNVFLTPLRHDDQAGAAAGWMMTAVETA